MEIFFSSVSSDDFMPHGHCYFWEPYILWSHAISDSIIALAYCVIPMTLFYIYLKRKDFKYIWVFILFAIFIFGCGMTHVFDVVTIWNPVYRMDSLARIITALASIGTALVLIKITPALLLIPTGEQWKQVNEELKAQIEKLEENERTIEAFKEFEQLTETLPQLVWTSTPEGKVSFYNRRWYQYTGLPFIPDMITSLQHIIQPQQLPKAITTWRIAHSKGEPCEMELLVRRFDGIYQWYLAQATPMQSKGKVQLWVCTLTHIHDHKIQAQELEEKNRELLVINADMDNFIYTASHDLKSPIANMEGLTTVLSKKLSGKLDGEEEKIIRLLIESAGRLRNTINDLTKIAAIQKDTLEDVEQVALADMFEEVKADLHPMIAGADALIKTEFLVPSLQIAQKNIRSIFYNLLTNAIKYRSPDRPLQIQVNAWKQGVYTVLTVKDNGMGIDPSQQHKLFVMFKRLHKHIEGTGIGLYIVKRIMENHGGKIEVTSEVDVGTTFHLFFPDGTK